jgi:hypothetical protein
VLRIDWEGVEGVVRAQSRLCCIRIIRGYAGEYELRVEHGELEAEITATIRERAQGYATIVLGPSPPPPPRHPLRRVQ